MLGMDGCISDSVVAWIVWWLMVGVAWLDTVFLVPVLLLHMKLYQDMQVLKRFSVWYNVCLRRSSITTRTSSNCGMF